MLNKSQTMRIALVPWPGLVEPCVVADAQLNIDKGLSALLEIISHFIVFPAFHLNFNHLHGRHCVRPLGARGLAPTLICSGTCSTPAASRANSRSTTTMTAWPTGANGETTARGADW